MAMIPDKLRPGDEVRVVSPAVSLGFIPQEQRRIAEERWRELGFRVSYSPNGEMLARFDSSPVEARVSDLHGAFADPGWGGCSRRSAATTPTSCSPAWTTA